MARQTGLDRPGGQWALTVAAGLVGAFLALFGQVYQTGADPYGLFLGWALLITPWAVCIEFGPLWAMWLVLVNIAAMLYLDQTTGAGQDNASWLGLLNALAWFAAERLKPRLGWPGFPVFLAICWTTVGAWSALLGGASPWAILLWVVFTGVGVVICVKMRSRAKLTAFGLGVVVMLTTQIGQMISWSDLFGFLLMGLAIVGEIAVLVHLVRRVPEPEQ